jgi:hypothetical protein
LSPCANRSNDGSRSRIDAIIQLASWYRIGAPGLLFGNNLVTVTHALPMRKRLKYAAWLPSSKRPAGADSEQHPDTSAQNTLDLRASDRERRGTTGRSGQVSEQLASELHGAAVVIGHLPAGLRPGRLGALLGDSAPIVWFWRWCENLAAGTRKVTAVSKTVLRADRRRHETRRV